MRKFSSVRHRSCPQGLDSPGLSSANNCPPQCSLPPVFVDEVLFEHGHNQSLTYWLWLLLCYKVKVEQLWETTWAIKSKISLSEVLEKKFADPWFRGMSRSTSFLERSLFLYHYCWLWGWQSPRTSTDHWDFRNFGEMNSWLLSKASQVQLCLIISEKFIESRLSILVLLKALEQLLPRYSI